MRQLLSPNGHVVLVGQSARENDHISFEIAKANDHWFHAHNVPGAHVLLQWAQGSNVLAEDIVFAATMAATYSKLSVHNRDVLHARGADIERPKRASKGTVFIAPGAESEVIRVRN